jgi:anti-sigma B factor antagonist
MSLPSCAVAVVPDRSHVRVVATGELDLATAPLLRRELDDLVTVGWLDVTVDLRETTFADSSALHVLLDAHRRLDGSGGALTVVVERGPVADLVAMTGAGRTLAIAHAESSRGNVMLER